MSIGYMDGISISMSERLSANQRALYAYVNHVVIGHNTGISISIGRMLMLNYDCVAAVSISA